MKKEHLFQDKAWKTIGWVGYDFKEPGTPPLCLENYPGNRRVASQAGELFTAGDLASVQISHADSLVARAVCSNLHRGPKEG